MLTRHYWSLLPTCLLACFACLTPLPTRLLAYLLTCLLEHFPSWLLSCLPLLECYCRLLACLPTSLPVNLLAFLFLHGFFLLFANLPACSFVWLSPILLSYLPLSGCLLACMFVCLSAWFLLAGLLALFCAWFLACLLASFACFFYLLIVSAQSACLRALLACLFSLLACLLFRFFLCFPACFLPCVHSAWFPDFRISVFGSGGISLLLGF